jgi:hypothetical protein
MLAAPVDIVSTQHSTTTHQHLYVRLVLFVHLALYVHLSQFAARFAIHAIHAVVPVCLASVSSAFFKPV